MLRRPFPVLALLVAGGSTLLTASCGDDKDAPPVRQYWAAPKALPDLNYSETEHPLTRSQVQNSETDALEQFQLLQINQVRGIVGVPPLTRDEAADALARAYAKHFTVHDFFGPVNPEGDALPDRALRASGFSLNGAYHESILYTVGPDPGAMFNAFLSSPTDYPHIFATDTNSIGIGIWQSGTIYYVVYNYVTR
jgi:uncharacterized protein YkwD